MAREPLRGRGLAVVGAPPELRQPIALRTRGRIGTPCEPQRIDRQRADAERTTASDQFPLDVGGAGVERFAVGVDDEDGHRGAPGDALGDAPEQRALDAPPRPWEVIAIRSTSFSSPNSTMASWGTPTSITGSIASPSRLAISRIRAIAPAARSWTSVISVNRPVSSRSSCSAPSDRLTASTSTTYITCSVASNAAASQAA
jgi:hypothetical protein